VRLSTPMSRMSCGPLLLPVAMTFVVTIPPVRFRYSPHAVPLTEK